MSVVYALIDLGRPADQTGLSTNLGGDLVVRKTGRREDGNLLPTGNRIHGVDGRNTSRDHFFGVHLSWLARTDIPCPLLTYTRVWVDRATVDVEVVLSKNLGALVDGLPRTIENTAQHVFGDTKLQAVSCEFDFGLCLSDMAYGNRPRRRTFLTSMPDVPSKTCVAIREMYRGGCWSQEYTWTTARSPTG